MSKKHLITFDNHFDQDTFKKTLWKLGISKYIKRWEKNHLLTTNFTISCEILAVTSLILGNKIFPLTQFLFYIFLMFVPKTVHKCLHISNFIIIK